MTKLDEALTTTITGVNDPETPSGRLSTGEILNKMELLKNALDDSVAKYTELCGGKFKTTTPLLRDLLTLLGGATKHATRLLEADR